MRNFQVCNGTVGPYIDPKAPVQIVTGSGVSFYVFSPRDLININILFFLILVDICQLWHWY